MIKNIEIPEKNINEANIESLRFPMLAIYSQLKRIADALEKQNEEPGNEKEEG